MFTHLRSKVCLQEEVQAAFSGLFDCLGKICLFGAGSSNWVAFGMDGWMNEIRRDEMR